MTDLNTLRDDALAELAGVLFQKLKATLIRIEETGKRPVVIVHENGMLDTMRINPPFAITSAAAAIRASKMRGE